MHSVRQEESLTPSLQILEKKKKRYKERALIHTPGKAVVPTNMEVPGVRQPNVGHGQPKSFSCGPSP